MRARSEQRHTVALILRRWQALQMADAFWSWKAIAAEKAWQRDLVVQAAQRQRQRTLQACFAAFRDDALTHGALRRAVVRLRDRTLAAAFATWRDSAREQRWAVSATTAALLQWRGRADAAALAAWADATAWRRHCRTYLLVCVGRLRSRVRRETAQSFCYTIQCYETLPCKWQLTVTR